MALIAKSQARRRTIVAADLTLVEQAYAAKTI